MFAKLLKMEFRSTWNVLGILCLSLVGAGLLGGLAIRYLVGASAPKEWLEVLCTLAITAAVLFFVVCGVAALIVQIVRFYRSRFTDEGYLTFTLPVTTHQVLLSSFLTSAVNLIAVAAVSVIGLILMGLCVVPDFKDLREGIHVLWQEFPELWARFTQADVLQAFGLLLVNAIVAFSNELILIMLAVTIGSLVAKSTRFSRRRLLLHPARRRSYLYRSQHGKACGKSRQSAGTSGNRQSHHCGRRVFPDVLPCGQKTESELTLFPTSEPVSGSDFAYFITYICSSSIKTTSPDLHTVTICPPIFKISSHFLALFHIVFLRDQWYHRNNIHLSPQHGRCIKGERL